MRKKKEEKKSQNKQRSSYDATAGILISHITINSSFFTQLKASPSNLLFIHTEQTNASTYLKMNRLIQNEFNSRKIENFKKFSLVFSIFWFLIQQI